MQTIDVDPSQPSVSINVARLSKGNYILELQGKGIYLTLEEVLELS